MMSLFCAKTFDFWASSPVEVNKPGAVVRSWAVKTRYDPELW